MDKIESNIVLEGSSKCPDSELGKVLAPGETLRNVKQVLEQVGLRLVKQTSRVDSHRFDIPVFVCVAGEDNNATQRQSMGKGSSPEQAEASALMELIERFSYANFPRPGDFLKATYDNVDDKSIPFDYFFFVPNKEATVPEENKTRFTELPFSWVPAYSLQQERDFLIPYEWFADIQGTNGLSAGNTLDETILQGLCEVVERHVSSVVNTKREPVPTIDMTTVKDPVARDLLRRFLSHGIRMVFKDFSLDTGIPTVGGIAYDPSSFPKSEIVFCAATATDPEKALIRVLTEIQQMAIDYFRQDYYAGGILPKFRTIQEARYLLSEDNLVPIDSLPDVSEADMKKEIEKCTTALTAIGYEPLVINITHPTLEIPSVFVIIPGSEQHDNLSRDLNTYYYIGRRLQHLGYFELAIDWYQKSIFEHPASSCHCYMQIGECYNYLGQYREAVDSYKTCFRYGPDRVMQISLYDSALTCMEKLKAGSALTS
ncbi:MAG: YcaO-like family protein [Chloroflexi bacterium]|jgi:ribosomal protein S12 methylthiotransferase accessory factor|nr:YcaO-like family protein [Chloroflexota bacterium]